MIHYVLTLVFTPGIRVLQRISRPTWHDWGEHTIRYGIYGHENDFKGTDHLARRFNQRIRSFSIDNDESTESKEELSLFAVSNNQLGILAVKKAEDSDDIIIRVYERYGEDLKADISFNYKLLEVKEVNGLEEPIGDIPFDKNKFTVTMQANGIRSYIVKINPPQRSYDIEQEISI